MELKVIPTLLSAQAGKGTYVSVCVVLVSLSFGDTTRGHWSDNWSSIFSVVQSYFWPSTLLGAGRWRSSSGFHVLWVCRCPHQAIFMIKCISSVLVISAVHTNQYKMEHFFQELLLYFFSFFGLICGPDVHHVLRLLKVCTALTAIMNSFYLADFCLYDKTVIAPQTGLSVFR